MPFTTLKELIKYKCKDAFRESFPSSINRASIRAVPHQPEVDGRQSTLSSSHDCFRVCLLDGMWLTSIAVVV